MKKVILYLCLLFSSLSLYATVPPEVPEQKTIQIFSPFYFDIKDNGEEVFLEGGPKLRGYKVLSPKIQRDAPTTERPAVNLETFLELLKQPAGIMMIGTHGEPTRLSVEAYAGGKEGKDKVEAAIASYYQAHQDWPIGLVPVCIPISGSKDKDIDCFNYPEKAKYWAIAVEPSFIDGIIKGIKKRDIIYSAGCHSYEFWENVENKSFVRNIAAFYGQISFYKYVFEYLFSSDGYKSADIIFNGMSGIKELGGLYQNFSIGHTISFAQAEVRQTSLLVNAKPPPAGNMRLYNAPRIIKVVILQEGKTIYSYDFAPYNNDNVTNYPFGVKPSSQTAKPGEFTIKLIFSEPMQTNFQDFYVKFKSNYREEEAELKTMGWLSSNFTNDTWIGSGTLEESANPKETITLAVNARRQAIAPDKDTANQRLDTDGDGYSNEEDTNHRFELLNMPPYLKKVKLTQAGYTVYEANWDEVSDTERSFNVSISGKIKNNLQIDIEFEFSKVVNNVGLYFEKTAESESVYVTGETSEDGKEEV